METEFLRTIILALVLGIASYSVAKRLKVPAILFYLLVGLAFGPLGLDVLHPAKLGAGLPILVEIIVPIILFEGGVSLSVQGLRSAPRSIQRVLFIALPLTGLGAGVGAHLLLGLSPKISVLFGAIIVVTGPTVIGPLLRAMKLSPKLETLLRYEAIWGDCIGVLASALALEFVQLEGSPSALIAALATRVLVGVLIGLGGALLLGKIILPWIKRLGDPSLPGMVALAAALGFFLESNALVGSSGALAAAVAGFALSAMKSDCLHEIRHFKDQVAMVVISMLFVLLSAAINPIPVLESLPRMVLLAVLLGLVVRPLAVHLALLKTPVTLAERSYIGLVGPRGIIAIATATYASYLLVDYQDEMRLLVAATFVVIFLSGTSATLAGGLFARVLKVSISEYQSGIVFVGINPLSVAIARFASETVPVRFVDASPELVSDVRRLGLPAEEGTALNDDFYDDAAEEGFRRVLIMTPNDALNELILRHGQTHFGLNQGFRAIADPSRKALAEELSSRFVAFSEHLSFMDAVRLLREEKVLVEVRPPEEIDGRRVIPLAERRARGGVRVVRAGHHPKQEALCLVHLEEPVELVQPGVISLQLDE